MSLDEPVVASGGIPVEEIEGFVAAFRERAAEEASLCRWPTTAGRDGDGNGGTAATLENAVSAVLRHFYGAGGAPATRARALLPSAAPFALSSVPTLADIADKQFRLVARVMSAVATRPVVTIYELERELCAETGVTSFSKLGFGRHLQCLPVVQQFFQVDASTAVLPVLSSHFIEYLLTSVDATNILRSTGAGTDTRSVMNGFCAYYERSVAPQMAGVDSGTRTARPVRNPRQLGVHLQNFSLFLTLLKQTPGLVSPPAPACERLAAAETCVPAQTMACDVVQAATVRLARNRMLYERAVVALDAALAASTAADSWSVLMSDAEAAATTVPLARWTTTSQDCVGRSGGLLLNFTVGSSAARTQPHPTRAITTTASDEKKTNVAPCAPSGPVALPAEPPAALRRRRGAVAVSEAVVAVPSGVVAGGSPVAVAALPLALAPADEGSLSPGGASQQNCAEATGLPLHSVGGAALADTQTTVRPPPSALAFLRGVARGATVASATEIILTGLSALRVGQVLDGPLLRDVFVRVVRAFDESAEDAKEPLEEVLKTCAFVPVPHPSRPAAGVGEWGAGGRLSAGPVEIVALARVEQLFWGVELAELHDEQTALAPGAEADDHWAERRRFFHADVSAVYPPEVCAFMRSAQGRIFGGGNFHAAWAFSCSINRRLYTLSDMLSAMFEDAYMRCFAACAEQAYRTVLRRVRSEAAVAAVGGSAWESVEEAALRRYADTFDAAPELPVGCCFAQAGHWLSAADGVYYAGEELFGFHGLRLRPAVEGQPELAVLRCSRRSLSAAVEVALRKLGVRALRCRVSRQVSFDSLCHSEAALLVHRALGLVAPYVQSLLLLLDRDGHYAFTHRTIAARLGRLRVVLGRRAELTEVLVDYPGRQDSLAPRAPLWYGSHQSVCLTYIPEHDALYGEEGHFSPAVLADGTRALFLPESLPRSSERGETLVGELLERLFRVFFAFTQPETGDGAPRGKRAREGGADALLLGDDPAVLQSLAAAMDAEALRMSRERSLSLPLRAITGALPPEWERVMSAVPAAARVPFAVPPVPPLRWMVHYPPGSDGLRQPPLARSRVHDTAGHAASSDGTANAASLLAVASRPGRGAAAVPQWRGDWARSLSSDPLDAILRAEESSRGTSTHSVSAPSTSERPTHSETRRISDSHHQQREPPLGTASRTNAVAQVDEAEQSENLLTFARPATVRFADGTSTADDTTDYARAAERFVVENVRRRIQEQNASEPHGQSGQLEVVWLNETGEQGTPYDIAVLRRGPAGSRHIADGGARIVEFIEVKSTCTSDRAAFEVSLRELLLAARYGRAFRVYRVYGASTSPLRKMRFVIYEDLLQLWYTGKLTLTGNVHVVPTQT